MLRDSVVVVVVVVRTRPRAIPLAMTTMRKSFMGFFFFPVMPMGFRLAALRAAGAPLKIPVPSLMMSNMIFHVVHGCFLELLNVNLRFCRGLTPNETWI